MAMKAGTSGNKDLDTPKQDGKGTRAPGISTVLDRFIRQTILQVLPPILDAVIEGRATIHGIIILLRPFGRRQDQV